jgi:Ca-activated chloride channel family protein
VVAVDVAVTRNGRPVIGLTAEDFEVRDNGILQEVDRVQVETAPVNAILILDNSVSVAGEKLAELRAAVRDFVDGLRENDRAALLAFSFDVQLLQDLTADPSLLLLALSRTSTRGGTALYEALYGGLMLAEPPVTRPIVVVFSDGEDTISRISESEVLEIVRESNAVVYAVRSSPSVPEFTPLDRRMDRHRRAQIGRDKFLREVTDSTGGRFWRIDAVSNFRQEFLRVLEEIKSRYLLTYNPKAVDEQGWHRLEVKLKNHKGQARARRGYFLSSTSK